MPNNAADYVVIGAGTAGCIVAARLAVDPGVTVSLLEVGGMDSNPAIYAEGLEPMFSLWNPQGAEDWGYATEPQPDLAGRAINVARGRVLGGCSAVNAMIYIRGNRRDFDAWAAAGNTGWSYEEVLPLFKKSETYHGPASRYHGDNGPLSVIDMQTPSVASHAFVEAAAALGAVQKYNDFNGEVQESGAGFYQSTRTLETERVTAASAFVRPILGARNFRLLTQVRASRLVIERGRVRGVEYLGPEGIETLIAEREVVLCCGTFETPKLLMLSGIGPADQLRRHGIAVTGDLPGVGENLQDHLLLGVGFECRTTLDPPEMLAEAGLFTWTDAADKAASPNLQYFFGPIQFVPDQYRTSAPGFTFAPILAQPRSRGTVTLASNDPVANARIDPRYLSRAEDVAVLTYGIRYARNLAQTPAFADLRGRELAPGAAVSSDDGLADYVRSTASTVWHPCGTCKMGADRDAVVDNQLRVRGIEGLRVADASVMPQLVNGNPNAAVMMIAEKAAELIRFGGMSPDSGGGDPK
ncbi:MAG: GMC family oxidoreductase N-terminal domain-containing protein [Defluviicoccus sp.]